MGEKLNTVFSSFKKYHDFLVCIDSDGCAIDSMEIKHKNYFAPEAIRVWSLQEIERSFIDKWCLVNLYSQTRGINRFKGLVKTMDLLSQEGFKVPDLNPVRKWIEKSEELSNSSLEKEISKVTNNKQLKNTLNWSYKVNEKIANITNKTKSFPWVKETLQQIDSYADVVVVSSANKEALLKEWSNNDLHSYIQLFLSQEAGSKAYCINALKCLGYSKDNILMIGDSLGDLKAAEENEVLFYPIIAQKESTSWKGLLNRYISLFFKNDLKTHQQKIIEEFTKTLN